MPLNPYTGEWESEPDDVQVPDPALVAREDEWNRASHELNKYKDKFDKDKSINWDAARRVFETAAASGKGTFNDWINQTVAADQRKLWLGTEAAAPAAGSTPAATGPTGPKWQRGGVDNTKWMDPAHKTPKYEVLRILDQWDPNQLGRPGLMGLSADQKKQLEALGYMVRDEDKIFRQDIGEIDVLHGDRTEYGWRQTGVGNTPPVKKPIAPTGDLSGPVYSHPGGEFGPTGPIAQPARKLGTGAPSLVSRDAAMTPWAPVGQSAPRAGNTLFQWDQPNAAPAPQQQNAAAMFDQMFRRFMAGQR